MNIRRRIRELGIGRYTSNILRSINIKSELRMSLLSYLQILLNPVIFFNSKLAKKYYPPINNSLINKNKKTFEFKTNQIVGLDKLVKHCLSIYNEKKQVIENNYEPPTFTVIGSRDKNNITQKQVDEIKPILKFASQPLLMSIATNYMGRVPIIFNATLTYTKKMEVGQKPINFQKFHIDMLDKSLLHLVIPIKNISEENGPFTYIDAPTSKKIISAVKYQGGRLNDKIIKKYTKKNNIIKLTGNVGKAWFVSPYYCLHMGARVNKVSRLLLIICYGSPNSAIEHVHHMHTKNIQNALLNNKSDLAEKHLLRLYS